MTSPILSPQSGVQTLAWFHDLPREIRDMTYRELFTDTTVFVPGRPCLRTDLDFDQELNLWRYQKLKTTKDKLYSNIASTPSTANTQRPHPLTKVFLVSKLFAYEARMIFFEECKFDLQAVLRQKVVPDAVLAPVRHIVVPVPYLTKLRRLCIAPKRLELSQYAVSTSPSTGCDSDWTFFLPMRLALQENRIDELRLVVLFPPPFNIRLDRVEVVKKARSFRLTFEPQYDDTTRRRSQEILGLQRLGHREGDSWVDRLDEDLEHVWEDENVAFTDEEIGDVDLT